MKDAFDSHNFYKIQKPYIDKALKSRALKDNIRRGIREAHHGNDKARAELMEANEDVQSYNYHLALLMREGLDYYKSRKRHFDQSHINEYNKVPASVR